MKNMWIICLVLVIPAVLMGCGDGKDGGSTDTSTETDVETDTATDTATDLQEDVTGDVQEDTAPDVVADTATDLEEDIATDEEEDSTSDVMGDTVADVSLDVEEDETTDAVVDVEADAVFDPEAAATEIMNARDTIDSASSLPTSGTWPISGTYVTFLKAGLGSDPQGFFVQPKQTGPALFVAYTDTATMPAVGDVVSFDIIELTSLSGIHAASGITGLATISSGHDVTFLSQDVSSVDIVTDLDLFGCELITVSGTFTSEFDPAGTGFQEASIDTATVLGGSTRLRVPQAVATSLVGTYSAMTGCDFDLIVETPLWRRFAEPQPSAFDVADIVINCPPPRLLAAASSSSTEVILAFDHDMDAASITDPSSQFSIIPSLSVSAASVTGTRITLTTSTQIGGATHTVMVFASVTDVLAEGVDASANSATFSGYTGLPTLVINEVDYDQPGADYMEFIEVLNISVSDVDLTGTTIDLINGSSGSSYDIIDLSPVGMLPSAGYLVIASADLITTGTIDSGATVITLEFPIQNGGADPDGMMLRDPVGQIIDALSYDGEIVGVTEGSTGAGTDSGDGSLCRCPNGSDVDYNDLDFQFNDPTTPGATNAYCW